MHFQVLSSGSQGNACLVRAGELTLLVDAGLPLDELERRLARAGVPLHRLDAIALTHGHLDHARAAGDLARKSGARVFCSERLMSNASVRRARGFSALRIGSAVEVRSRRGSDVLLLHAVPVPHDAEPTVAFRLEHEGRRAVVATDLGEPGDGLGEALAGAHLLLLEFNHDPELLARGPYSFPLKRRIAGSRGHLSNRQAAELLRSLAGPELHTLLVAHLSAVNNTPELASAAAVAALAGLGLGAVQVLLAAQDQIGPNLRV